MRLVLVLGDQLAPALAGLRRADRTADAVVMAEVREEATYVPHHPKKIAFCFAAMRKFAGALAADGWDVRYTRLDDPENAGSIAGELLRRAAETGATEVIATEPGEFRLARALGGLPLDVTLLEDDRFVASHRDFRDWAAGRRELRMEWFYREMRRKTGLLMEGDAPAGGRWNLDAENRRPPPAAIAYPGPLRFAPDAVTDAVLDLVEREFGSGFGRLRPFWFATDRAGALRHLAHWIEGGLPGFGAHQDAMLAGNAFLNHAFVSVYMNAGLLDPLEVCRAVEAAWKAGRVPLNSAEGFIRQVIGWREFVRGIYHLHGPDYLARNVLRHERPLPALYWGGETAMACLAHAVAETERDAYAHHIQRLMVLGNFALLAGVNPGAVHDWFLAVYADAYGWVMAANVIGMSQHADGGIAGSKPYVSSGAYIDRMSDYCRGCAYSPKIRTGQGACPFNLLYWHFLDRHRDRFAANPRMANMYRTWERMDPDRRATVLAEAEALLGRLDAGEPV